MQHCCIRCFLGSIPIRLIFILLLFPHIEVLRCNNKNNHQSSEGCKSTEEGLIVIRMCSTIQHRINKELITKICWF
jgi:hypothetical protein